VWRAVRVALVIGAVKHMAIVEGWHFNHRSISRAAFRMFHVMSATAPVNVPCLCNCQTALTTSTGKRNRLIQLIDCITVVAGPTYNGHALMENPIKNDSPPVRSPFCRFLCVLTLRSYTPVVV
jgi:hypothetical protein